MIQNQNMLLLYLIQIISIYNAILMGWNVKKLGKNTYELTKTIDVSDNNLTKFIEAITQISK